MFINPKIAIENGWISHVDPSVDWSMFVQPNAIDFTLDRLFTIYSDEPFFISERFKQMRGGEEVQPEMISLQNYKNVPKLQQYGDQQMFIIPEGAVMDGMSNFYVKVPEGVACEFIIRSTLNRNGIFITSGLYDSGFEGHLGFAIHNRSYVAYIAPGTRIGQIKFVESDSAGKYSGGWNHTKGSHYTEEQKDG